MAKNALLSLLLLLGSVKGVFAQEATPKMADRLRADGKIWVVVLVLATIFAGIIAFLIYIERRLARLEKRSRS